MKGLYFDQFVLAYMKFRMQRATTGCGPTAARVTLSTLAELSLQQKIELKHHFRWKQSSV